MDKSWMPTLAGILDIVSGAMALIGFLALAFSAVIVGSVPDGQEFPLPSVVGLLGCLSLVILVVAVVAVVGGIFVLQHRQWGWAVAGSIAATLACPPLGIPAVVLTVLAQEELQKKDG